MKAVIISCLLFAIMIAAILANRAYIHQVANQMISDLEELAGSTNQSKYPEQIQAIRKAWQKRQPFIQITVNRSKIETITNTIDELYASSEDPSSIEFKKARSILVSMIKNIMYRESISPSNIL